MTTVQPDPVWRNPRKTIAHKYKDNDFGYVTHGTLAALQVYKLFDLPPSVTKDLTVLDYGCGTGREARTLSVLFKHVYAYDPTIECLEEFFQETKLCERDFTNITLINDVAGIPQCDVGYSLHVMEHLSHEQAELMLNNLKAKITTSMVLAYATRNSPLISPLLTPEQLLDEQLRNKQPDRGVRFRHIKF